MESCRNKTTENNSSRNDATPKFNFNNDGKIKEKKKRKETQLNKSQWCNTVLNVVTSRTMAKYHCLSTKFHAIILVAQPLVSQKSCQGYG